MMRHASAVFVISVLCSQPLLARADSSPSVCGQPSCGTAFIAKTPEFPAQIDREGDFAADVVITQPCSCTRHLSIVLSFTPKGTNNSRERSFDRDIASGTSTTHLTLTRAELAKLKIKPGRHTVGFALLDERQQRSEASSATLAGLQFVFGKSGEQLAAKPIVPAHMPKDATLAVPFVFKNSGDIVTSVTALLAFTRPDTTETIEFYKENLPLSPGQVTHIVNLSAAQRSKLGIGSGAWLVTTAAFDGAGAKLDSYPGQLLMLGNVLSVPVAPSASSPIKQSEDLSITLTLKNDADVADLVTAVLVFSRSDVPHALEYKVEGVHVPTGTTTHTIVLSSLDRYNIGIRPGKWRMSASALDRAGKRLELRRGNDVVIADDSVAVAK